MEAEETQKQEGAQDGGSQRPRESFGKAGGQLWVLLLRMREEWALIWLTEPGAVPPLHPGPEDSEVPPLLELRELGVG